MLYFYLHIQCKYFVLCSFVLYLIAFFINLFSNVLFQTFDYFWKHRPTLLISLCCCVDIFNIKFRFCETFTVIYSVTRTLLTETLYKFRTIKYWFTLHLQIHVWASINSNVLYIPPHFLVFHIFAVSQLKTSGICTVSNNQKTYFAF